MEYEEEDSEEELNRAFDTLLAENDSDDDNTPESSQSDSFTADVFTIAIENESITTQLANRAFEHRITQVMPKPVNEVIEAFPSSRYTSKAFLGIIIDTGASRYSTAGYGQFEALQRKDNSIVIDETTKGTVTVKFGIGSASSVGSTIVNTPIGQVKFHINTCRYAIPTQFSRYGEPRSVPQ